MNLNDFARDITLDEGGKVNLSQPQVKEVVRLTLERIFTLGWCDLAKLRRQYRRIMKRKGIILPEED